MAVTVELPAGLSSPLPRQDFELSMIALKPQYSLEETANLYLKVEGLIEREDLRIILTATKQLTVEDVKELYDKVFEDLGDEDSSWFIDYRNELIRHMTSGPILSILVSGQDASAKVNNIKSAVRSLSAKSPNELKVMNYVHTPENDEIDNSLSILMGVVHLGKICVTSEVNSAGVHD